MIVKTEDSQQRSMDPKPLFIDCGDPNYVFKVQDISNDIMNEDLGICLIFLQQLIFYEFMLGKTSMVEKAKYFIPSYTRHFVEGTRKGILEHILKNPNYNFTLKHYSRINDPLIMLKNCLAKYAEESLQPIITRIIGQENIERKVQSKPAGGKSERQDTRSRFSQMRHRPH